MISSPPGAASAAHRISSKNACPLCGQPKTAWSLKCGTCEGTRQKYLAAVERTDADRRFLIQVQERGQSKIAREMGISRQRVHQLVQNAQRRVNFLSSMQDTATVH